MGIEVGVIAGALSAIATFATEHAILTAIVIGALQAGLSYTISALTAPKPPGPLSNSIDRIRNIQRDPQAPGRVYYGHGFGSGYLVYARVTNQDGKQVTNARYLHSCLIVAVGPISGITKFHLNDEDDINTFGDLISFVPFNGAWDQPMFKGPVGIRRKQVELPQEWLKENRPLSGIAYVWMTMAAHPQIFPGGPPQVRMEIDGAIIYDRRSPAQKPDDPYTWEFSNNWAVCVYDYLTNKDYGRGARHDQICIDCFLESAGISDQDTPAPSNRVHDTDDMPYIKRYTIDGSFETNEQPVDIMTGLAAAAAGTITFYDGLWHIRAGGPRATMLDMISGKQVILTADNLRDDEPIQINVRPGRKEAANIVRGSYVSPTEKFTVQDFPEQTHPDFVKEDGGVELETNLELPFCLEVDRAQRLARISLYMGRLGMRVIFPGGPELLQIPPWEVIELAFPEYGWGGYDDDGIMIPNIEDPTTGLVSYKQFYVVDRHFNENGGINLMLAEYSNAMYSDTIDPALLPERSDLPDPFEVFPPQNVAVVEMISVQPDGTRLAALRLTWEPPEDGYAESYTVIWRRVGSLDPFMSRTVPGGLTTTTVSGLEATDIIGLEVGQYEIQIQTRVLSRLSAPVIVYGTITYETAPPPVPVDFRVSLMANGTRLFSWGIAGGIEPPDIDGYEIRYARGEIIPAWNDALPFLTDIKRQNIETKLPTAEGKYVFLIKSFDTSGSYSEFFDVTQVLISPRESTDLANREYSEEFWPGECVDCRVNAMNHLAAYGHGTWNRVSSWAAMNTWAAGPMRIVYTPPPITLDAPDFATFEFKVEGINIDGFYVQVRSRASTADDFSDFSFVTGASGLQFQFRLIAWNNGMAAVAITKFYAALHAKDETDQIQNVHVPHTTPVQRVEDSTMLQSTGQVTHLNALPAGITLDTNTWARLVGTDYIDFPIMNTPVLADGAVEITIHVNDAAQQQGRIVGRGNDWSLDYTVETFGGVSQSVIRLNATGYTGSFTPIAFGIGQGALGTYEITIVVDDGIVKMYVNRELVGTTGSSSFAFALSSNDVAIGARMLSSTPSNFAAIDVKEFRVWRVPLMPDEVRAYSGVSVNPATSGLAGYWRLDDDFATTFAVRDRTEYAQTGQAHGASRVRIGSRLSPPIDLAIIPKWNILAATWAGTVPTGTGISVYMGIGVGDAPPTTWTTVFNTTTFIPTPMIPVGTDATGYKIWCLQVLGATDITKTPTLTRVTTTIVLHPLTGNGNLVVQPPHPFSVIRQVSLTVRSDLGVTPIGWNLVAHDPVAARFIVYDPVTGAPVSADVDVLFQGSRVWA